MSIIRMMPFAGLLVCLGCANQEPPPAAPQSAQREAMVSASAVVEHVNQASRVVRVRMMDGSQQNILAGPQVQNLAAVFLGDTVRLTYYEKVSASIAKPDAGGPAQTSVVSSRAPAGSPAGGLVRTTTDMVVEFVKFDPATGVVTFKTSEGETRSVEVDPEMRAFAAARQPGERVALQMTNAVAASIVETGS